MFLLRFEGLFRPHFLDFLPSLSDTRMPVGRGIRIGGRGKGDWPNQFTIRGRDIDP
jgi:hypothetical protein